MLLQVSTEAAPEALPYAQQQEPEDDCLGFLTEPFMLDGDLCTLPSLPKDFLLGAQSTGELGICSAVHSSIGGSTWLLRKGGLHFAADCLPSLPCAHALRMHTLMLLLRPSQQREAPADMSLAEIKLQGALCFDCRWSCRRPSNCACSSPTQHNGTTARPGQLCASQCSTQCASSS